MRKRMFKVSCAGCGERWQGWSMERLMSRVMAHCCWRAEGSD